MIYISLIYNQWFHCMKYYSRLIQWRENRIFASQNLDSGLTNIQKVWFGFDKMSSNIWSRIFEYLTLITWLGNGIFRIRGGQSDHWFSATNRLSRTLIGQFKLKIQQVQTSPLTVMSHPTKRHVFFNWWFHPKVHRNHR